MISDNRETMLQIFGLSRGDYTYAASVFYHTDNNGNEQLSLKDLGFVLNIAVIIVSSNLISILSLCDNIFRPSASPSSSTAGLISVIS